PRGERRHHPRHDPLLRPDREGDRHRLGGQRGGPHLPGRDQGKPLLPAEHPLPAAPADGRRARPGLGHRDRGRGDREDARAGEPDDRARDRAALRKGRQGHRAELLDERRAGRRVRHRLEDHPQRPRGMTPWWRGAVLYHVYVRSFFDADGDGQGDLAGVAAKLDYIASLGVDGIWLSPIHPSPDRDWGYDVADYEGVHADYGTLADFEALLEAAHDRGLKVLLDEVLAHTSDEHPWFIESLTGGNSGPKADWYVW